MEKYLKQTRRLMLDTVRKLSGASLSEPMELHFAARGKLNRPKAVALLGEALGIAPERTVGWAAALELFHNGSLAHDDLQDGDVQRRGGPALWKVFGPNKAMNAGTFMMLAAGECLRGQGSEEKTELQLRRILFLSGLKALEGQCAESELNKLIGARGLREAYLKTASLKSGALFGALAAGVAFIGGREKEEIQKLENLFVELGTIFQLQDDVLDLYGNKMKDIQGNDLKEGKVSFLILKHLEIHHYNAETVKKLLAMGREEMSRGAILVAKEQFALDGTLESALEELARRCKGLLGDPWLHENPGVEKALSAMVGELVKPLIHLEKIQIELKQYLSNALVGLERSV